MNTPDTITIRWTVSDILSRDESLTITDARHILKTLKDNHNASIGINWDVVDQTIQEIKMSKCVHMNEAMLCYQCKYIEMIKMRSDDQKSIETKDHEITLLKLENEKLRSENEYLKDIAIGEVHTCSKHCKRPMCVMRMNNEKLTNVLEIAESQMSTAVKYLKDDGSDKLENTEPEHQMFYGLSYALSQIEKIKKEEL